MSQMYTIELPTMEDIQGFVGETFVHNCNGVDDAQVIQAIVNDFYDHSTEMNMLLIVNGEMGSANGPRISLNSANSRGAKVFIDFRNAITPTGNSAADIFLTLNGGINISITGLVVTNSAANIVQIVAGASVKSSFTDCIFRSTNVIGLSILAAPLSVNTFTRCNFEVSGTSSIYAVTTTGGANTFTDCNFIASVAGGFNTTSVVAEATNVQRFTRCNFSGGTRGFNNTVANCKFKDCTFRSITSGGYACYNSTAPLEFNSCKFQGDFGFYATTAANGQIKMHQCDIIATNGHAYHTTTAQFRLDGCRIYCLSTNPIHHAINLPSLAIECIIRGSHIIALGGDGINVASTSELGGLKLIANAIRGALNDVIQTSAANTFFWLIWFNSFSKAGISVNGLTTAASGTTSAYLYFPANTNKFNAIVNQNTNF